MLKAIIHLLKTTNLNTEDIKTAKGKYKFLTHMFRIMVTL